MTARRIDAYRPRIELSDQALDSVRAAVRRAKPASPAEASLLMHAAARHARWALDSGERTTLRHMFSPRCVAASVAAADAAATGSISPYRSNLNRLARAVQGTTRRVTPNASAGPVRPYSTEERTLLLAAAGGMPDEEAMCFEAAYALGAGAGIIGPLASGVRSEHLTTRAEQLVATAPGVGPVAIRGPWAEKLMAIAADRPDVPLTTYYTSSGYQRVRRALARNRGVPDFDPHRLRTGYLVDLLTCDVPIDVLASVAGVRGSTLHKYAELLPRASVARLERWLTAEVAPSPDEEPFRGLVPVPAPGRRVVADAATQIATQRPRDATVARVWDSADGAHLRELIAARATTAKGAHRLLTATFVLLGWAVRQPGLPLTPEALLKETTLARWVGVERAAGRDPQSTASYLAALRSLTRPLPRATMSSQAARQDGYSAEDVAVLVASSDPAEGRLPERLRRVLATYVHGQLGTGMAPQEALALRGSDIVPTRAGVRAVIGGKRERVLPVTGEHASGLSQLAAGAGTGPLCGFTGNVAKRYRDELNHLLPLALEPRRLQTTWLQHQLERGVPVDVLIASTGLTLSAIGPLVDRCPPRSVAELVAWSGHLG